MLFYVHNLKYVKNVKYAVFDCYSVIFELTNAKSNDFAFYYTNLTYSGVINCYICAIKCFS